MIETVLLNVQPPLQASLPPPVLVKETVPLKVPPLSRKRLPEYITLALNVVFVNVTEAPVKDRVPFVTVPPVKTQVPVIEMVNPAKSNVPLVKVRF